MKGKASDMPPMQGVLEKPDTTAMSATAKLTQAAQTYRDNHHWVPLRLEGKSPECMGKGWLKRTLNDAIPKFENGDNIGILLGKPSGDIVRLDPDFEAIDEVTAILFPEPTLLSGRKSSPRSGRLYICKGIKSRDFQLPSKGMKDDPRLPLHDGESSLKVFQILSTGKQHMAPPSVHPESREEVFWVNAEAKIKTLDEADLLRRVGIESFCMAVRQFWPARGTRNEAAMALARVLLEAFALRIPNEEERIAVVDAMVLAVAMAGGDGQASRNGKERAAATLRKMEDGEEAVGMSRLVELLELPKEVMKTFRKWLGITATEKFGDKGDDPALAEMNERCAAGSVKGKFRVIKWVPDARHPYQRIAEFNSKGDFCNAVVNPKIEIPKFNSKGEKIGTEPIGRGKWWLGQDGRQEFDGIDYRPGQPEKIEVHDRHNGRTLCILNMYAGFAVEPDFEDSAKKCPLYLAHVHNNVAGGNEELNTYILDWEASGVQHPEDPGRSALSMRGDPGAGKGVFALYYGGIFGRHFLHVTNKDHVTGKFNAHSAETCLIFVDEALYAEIRADAQILKTLTSETTKILERKGIDPVEIDNYARLMFATNEEHPIQIEHNDRRYCAIYVQNNSAWVNETSEQVKADKRAEYFRPIIDEMNNGGRAALLGFLLRRDISKFNPERIPSTTERNAQKLMSAPAGDKIIIEFAIDGHLPGAVSAERAWLARANGEGCLYPSLRERGGGAVAHMTDMALASLLKRWKFERHPLGDGAGWSAPKLADLRLAISTKYPGRKWDERIGDWGQCVDEAVVEDEHKAKEAEDDPPF